MPISLKQLGDGTPTEVFIGPLISRPRVIGLLYGDSLPDRKVVGDVEPLVIFPAQAGISTDYFNGRECKGY